MNEWLPTLILKILFKTTLDASPKYRAPYGANNQTIIKLHDDDDDDDLKDATCLFS